MPLIKTTIVPPGDANAVLNQPIIKMIVIVNDPDLAQLADNLARNPPIVDRQVVWFPGGLPANFQATFNIDHIDTALAFSLKIDNTVADIITTDDRPVDAVRMAIGYNNAGL